MKGPWRLQDLADWCGGQPRGDLDRELHSIQTLEAATERDLSFLGNKRYKQQAKSSSAGALIVAEAEDFPKRDLILHPQPHLALSKLLSRLYPEPPPADGISPLASIDAEAKLAEQVNVGPFAVIGAGVRLESGVSIGAGAVIGSGVHVGEASMIYPNVTIYPRVKIGADCRIHSGAVIGADGFGYATEAGEHHRIPQIGGVILEDGVDVGAGTTIDAGSLGPTRIGKGTKIDDQVMIAHGVQIGEGCLLASQAGIAGSTELGDQVQMAGQSGIAGHLKVAAGTIIGAKSAVLQDVDPANFVLGIPASDHRVWKRSQVQLRKLASLQKQIRKMQQQLKSLEDARAKGEE